MKVLISLAAGIGVVGMLFYFGLIYYPTNCLVVGSDICHFAEAEKLLRNEASHDWEWRYARMMELCGKMGPAPKRDKCYYFVATVSSDQQVLAACDLVMADGGYSKQECVEQHGFRRDPNATREHISDPCAMSGIKASVIETC